MKAKSVFVGIAVVAVVLLLLSVTAVSKVLSANPSELISGVKTQPIAAKFLPKQSPLVASFLVNPERLNLFATLAAKPSDRASLRNEVSNLKQQIKQTWSLDYDKHIKPWLGTEVTLAVTTTDIDRQTENGFQPGYLLALAIKEQSVAKKSFERFWQELAVKGSDIAFEQYQGISIINTKGSPKQPALAGAIFGKFVVFANQPKVIRNAINDLQVPDLALVNFDLYQQNLTQLQDGRFAIAFVNTTELGAWAEAEKFLPTSLANLPKLGLGLGLSLDRLGVKAETTLIKDPATTSASLVSESNKDSQNKAVQFIPNSSSLFAGHNLSQTWQQLQANLQAYPQLSTALADFVNNIETSSSFNLNQDIFAWVKDDYAVGLLPVKSNQHNPDWVFIAKNTDMSAVSTALDHLDSTARNKANLTVGEVNVNNRDLTVWTHLSAIPNSKPKSANTSVVTGTVAAVHTETPDYVFIGSSIEAIEAVLDSDRNSITKAPNFKAVNAKLPRNHQSYAYLDDRLDLDWISKQFPVIHPVESLGKPLAPHIKAVSITSIAKTASEPANLQRGQIFIAVK